MQGLFLEDEFGDVIGKARRGTDLSVAELAKRSGIATTTIEAFEGYRRDPERAQSDAIAAALGLRPGPLWELACESWLPEPVDYDLDDDVRVEPLWFEPDRVWAYLVGDQETCVAIDCGAPIGAIEVALRERDLLAIVLTHADADHTYSLAALLSDRQIPVFVHAAERELVSGSDVRSYHDGDLVTNGRYRFSVLHAPGHTPGCCGLHTAGAVFTGDTMFAASIGGTRMGPEYFRSQISAVRAKILSLPGDTKLFPGHGAHTTVEEELAHNSFF